MAEEKIRELERKVQESYNLLVKLNDEYNQLLTEEHEKKHRQSVGEDEKEELHKIDIVHSIIWGLTLLLGLFHIIPFSMAMLILFVNTFLKIYRMKKTNDKYHSSDAKNRQTSNNDWHKKSLADVPKELMKDVKIKLSPAEEKADLYERVFEARCNYHQLRKELESKKLNREIEVEQQNIGEEQMDLFSQYQAYIDYIGDVIMKPSNAYDDSNIKMYELKSDDYK